ncbi:MAG TPA: hypothetical protein PKC76_13880 [Saprospiraceae bacterium]|nr:hypothetical protein [Saprospiraceae bacterium]HMP25225.1 hypothetical protein [Saprospiraceae bacterium]
MSILLWRTIIYTQTFRLDAGVSHSVIDWTYLNPTGTSREQYNALLIGYAVGLGVEYMDPGLLLRLGLDNQVEEYNILRVIYLFNI